jgi:NAD(P)-dependent dehydrogenase (short-subunit alcohol dehydrogenase family)
MRQQQLYLGFAVALSFAVAMSRRWAAGPCPHIMDAPPFSMEGRTAVVTGANTGIGKQTARNLAIRGGSVILACRSVAKGEAAIADIRAAAGEGGAALKLHAMYLDLASLASVRDFAKAVTKRVSKTAGSGLDVLVLNAGVMGVGASKTMRVNHVGHSLLTQLLIPQMVRVEKKMRKKKKNNNNNKKLVARVVVVSSDFQKFGNTARFADDLEGYVAAKDGEIATSLQGYQDSKLANVLFASELQRRADHAFGAGALVAVSLHPGGIITDITRNWFPRWLNPAVRLSSLAFLKTVEEGAMTTTHGALAAELEPPAIGGRFLCDCRVVDPNAGGVAGGSSDNRTAAKLLWESSVRLVDGVDATVMV